MLIARRRIRDFEPLEEFGRALCVLSPRWIAEDNAPAGLRAHETDALSAANWVKRRWRQAGGGASDLVGFPSTSSIASAPFRLAVLGRWSVEAVRSAVTQLQAAVRAITFVRETPVDALSAADPGGTLSEWFVRGAGPWVYPDVWDAASLWREVGERRTPMPADFPDRARAGLKACRRLLDVMGEATEVSAPSSYLAVVLQDLDNMGRFLGGEGAARDGRRLVVDADEHAGVSQRLVELGRSHRRSLVDRRILGVPVYAGGDDLLAFTPASTAIAAATVCHGEVPADLPTASTAVLLFHRSTSLRVALTQARELLAEAKESRTAKHALGVGFLRRSGVRETSVQPWSHPAAGEYDTVGPSAADLFAVFGRPGTGRGLSPRLVNALERDRQELADPAFPEEIYRDELARLVRRHGGSDEDATALRRLGMYERARPDEDGAVRGGHSPGGRGVPARAARVAVFLRQECAAVPVMSAVSS